VHVGLYRAEGRHQGGVVGATTGDINGFNAIEGGARLRGGLKAWNQGGRVKERKRHLEE
jgi:N-acetylneuraminic acid mutarotase